MEIILAFCSQQTLNYPLTPRDGEQQAPNVGLLPFARKTSLLRSVVTQRFSGGGERCVTSQVTAAKETREKQTCCLISPMSVYVPKKWPLILNYF